MTEQEAAGRLVAAKDHVQAVLEGWPHDLGPPPRELEQALALLGRAEDELEAILAERAEPEAPPATYTVVLTTRQTLADVALAVDPLDPLAEVYPGRLAGDDEASS